MIGMANISANYANILNVIGCTSATTKTNNFPKSTLLVIVRVFSHLRICAQIWKENKFSVESYYFHFSGGLACRHANKLARPRCKQTVRLKDMWNDL